MFITRCTRSHFHDFHKWRKFGQNDSISVSVLELSCVFIQIYLIHDDVIKWKHWHDLRRHRAYYEQCHETFSCAVRMNEIRNTRRSIHRWTMDSLHKWPVTRKSFPFDDVIMKGEHGPDLNSLGSDPGECSKFLLTLCPCSATIVQHFPSKFAHTHLCEIHVYFYFKQTAVSIKFCDILGK